MGNWKHHRGHEHWGLCREVPGSVMASVINRWTEMHRKCFSHLLWHAYAACMFFASFFHNLSRRNNSCWYLISQMELIIMPHSSVVLRFEISAVACAQIGKSDYGTLIWTNRKQMFNCEQDAIKNYTVDSVDIEM